MQILSGRHHLRLQRLGQPDLHVFRNNKLPHAITIYGPTPDEDQHFELLTKHSDARQWIYVWVPPGHGYICSEGT